MKTDLKIFATGMLLLAYEFACMVVLDLPFKPYGQYLMAGLLVWCVGGGLYAIWKKG